MDQIVELPPVVEREVPVSPRTDAGADKTTAPTPPSLPPAEVRSKGLRLGVGAKVIFLALVPVLIMLGVNLFITDRMSTLFEDVTAQQSAVTARADELMQNTAIHQGGHGRSSGQRQGNRAEPSDGLVIPGPGPD